MSAGATSLLLLALAAPDGRALSLFRSVAESNPPTDDRLSCSYTTVARVEGRLMKERFTPEEGWQLLAINERPPTREELERYARGATDRGRRGQPTEFDLATMAREDTVALADEDYETLTFTFALAPSEDGPPEAFLDKLQGTLTVRKSGFIPTRFVLEALDEVSPAPTVTIREFRQEMSFLRDPDLDALLVEELQFSIRGRAFLFRTLDDNRRVRYRDYDCVPLSPWRPSTSPWARSAQPDLAASRDAGARSAV